MLQEMIEPLVGLHQGIRQTEKISTKQAAFRELSKVVSESASHALLDSGFEKLILCSEKLLHHGLYGLFFGQPAHQKTRIGKIRQAALIERKFFLPGGYQAAQHFAVFRVLDKGTQVPYAADRGCNDGLQAMFFIERNAVFLADIEQMPLI